MAKQTNSSTYYTGNQILPQSRQVLGLTSRKELSDSLEWLRYRLREKERIMGERRMHMIA